MMTEDILNRTITKDMAKLETLMRECDLPLNIVPIFFNSSRWGADEVPLTKVTIIFTLIPSSHKGVIDTYAYLTLWDAIMTRGAGAEGEPERYLKSDLVEFYISTDQGKFYDGNEERFKEAIGELKLALLSNAEFETITYSSYADSWI
tara:strand:- start:3308 stop:3751 length:444 start_codon:yes stop_codon:yes gene_type:complete